MNKYSCIYNSGSYLYRAVCVAEDENTARELVAEEANREWPRYGLADPKKWNVMALAVKCASGPARVLDLRY